MREVLLTVLLSSIGLGLWVASSGGRAPDPAAGQAATADREARHPDSAPQQPARAEGAESQGTESQGTELEGAEPGGAPHRPEREPQDAIAVGPSQAADAAWPDPVRTGPNASPDAGSKAKPAEERPAAPSASPLESLQVTVVDPNGTPVPEASVRVISATGGELPWQHSHRAREATTDAAGRASFTDQPAGRAAVTIHAAGFALIDALTTVQLGRSSSLTLHAIPTPILAGRVMDAESNPIAGAMVSCAGRETTTDSQGVYRLTELPLGLHHVSVTRPGEAVTEQADDLELTAGAKTEWSPTLATLVTARGVLLDETGRSLARHVVQAQAGAHGVRAETDAEGRFEFLLRGDRDHQLTVRAPGSWLPSRSMALPARSLNQPLTIRLPERELATGWLTGRLEALIATNGVPRMRVVAADGRARQLRPIFESTDRRFRIGPLPPGRWSLVVESAPHELPCVVGPFALEAGQSLDVGSVQAARRTARITLTARDTDGAPPAPDTTVLVEWLNHRGIDCRAPLSAFGSGEVQVPAGQFRLTLEGNGLARRSHLVEVGEGETGSAVWEAAPALHRVLRIDLPTGHAGGTALVVDQSHAEVASGALEQRSSWWTITAAPGPHTVLVTTTTGRQWRGQFEVAPASPLRGAETIVVKLQPLD